MPLIHGSTDNRRITTDVARLLGTGDGPPVTLLLSDGGPGSGIELLRDIARSGELPARK